MRLPIQSIGISRQTITTPVQAGIVPSRFSWINVGLPELASGYWDRLLAETFGDRWNSGACDLTCGEQRADCFREGGSRAECDQQYMECGMDCFFNA